MRRAKAGQLDLPLRQQQAIGRAYLALEGTLVGYTIKRSLRRRAISILVDEEGLRVGAPWSATHNAIERLLRQHSAWVLKKLQEWQVRRAPVRRWADGESLMLLGMPFTLRLVPGAGVVELRGDELCVGADSDTPVARRVHEWMHAQALRCFEERVEHYRRLLDIAHPPRVLLSSARTRWGSCHTSGRIHLNWRLVQMPPRLLDYVVAHEVAHLVEMNHSPRFWRLVGKLVPDHATCRKELRHEGHRYLLV
jgi:predicted metal-dependent hydrolase